MYKKITRLGIDRVKPWNSVRINLGLGLKGPDVGPILDKRNLIILVKPHLLHGCSYFKIKDSNK